MEPIKFIHIADTHLGKRQYNLQERYDDFFNAFQWVLDLAIKEEVDFILIAGDIFDKKNVNPSVLSQLFYLIRDFKATCEKILKRTIPLICIEGNHDNPIYTSHSWMSFLADLDLIVLLSGIYNKETKTVEFEPYSPETHRGGMYQIKDTSIYGLPFFGSFTSQLFPAVQNAISNSDNYNILMMHFGIEGEDKVKPGISVSPPLEKLHEIVDYMALGHYHKQYVYPKKDPWIYNPGSLEINDLTELKQEIARGAFIVEVKGKKYYEQTINSLVCENGNYDQSLIPNRKFFKISDIDISNTKNFDEAIDLIVDRVQKFGIPLNDSDTAVKKADLNCPIIVLSIIGEIGYSRLEISINKLRDEIERKFNILDVRVFSKSLFSRIEEIGISDNNMTIDEIERDIVSAIIDENEILKPTKTELLNLLEDIKNSLIQSHPDYKNLQDRISEWCMLNIEGFQKPRKIEKTVIETEVETDQETEQEGAKKKALQERIKQKQEQLTKMKSKEEEDIEFELFGEFDLDEHIDDGSEEEK